MMKLCRAMVFLTFAALICDAGNEHFIPGIDLSDDQRWTCSTYDIMQSAIMDGKTVELIIDPSAFNSCSFCSGSGAIPEELRLELKKKYGMADFPGTYGDYLILLIKEGLTILVDGVSLDAGPLLEGRSAWAILPDGIPVKVGLKTLENILSGFMFSIKITDNSRV